MIALMGSADRIITGSGGIQKEACMPKVPCITLRQNTGRVETVESGWNVLAGASKARLLETINK
jgi:UDP-N-acetylglucosamine 2-epimerase